MKTMIWQYCPEKYMIQQNPDIEKELKNLLNENDIETNIALEELDEEEEDFFENSKINFWACHCNFDIDRRVFNIIKQAVGIEFIQVKTRYCFLIAVGKLFQFNDVRKKIEYELQCTSEVNSTVEALKEISKYWACLVKQDGDIEYACGEENSAYTVFQDVEFYQAYIKRYGGRLIISEALELELEEDADNDNKFKSDI